MTTISNLHHLPDHLRNLLHRIIQYKPPIDQYDTRRRAGVLIPLVEAIDGSDLHIVLTIRANHLRIASGDVVFPGGKMDETDGDVRATALRETREEINLPESGVLVLSKLPNYLARDLIVTPFVGYVTDPLWKRKLWNKEKIWNDAEVREVLTFPLKRLLQDGDHHFSFDFVWHDSELGGDIPTRFHRFRHPHDPSTVPLQRPRRLPPGTYPPYPALMGFTAHACITCAEIAYGQPASFEKDLPGGMNEDERIRRFGQVQGTWDGPKI
ncbi:hypothetical protein M427DRAFT_51209 [Gonapodya prolifera JEL478]|uniref:Nudix hydrolase domain-containing protein n=1 Tax=Gonapodya prolifera (strain JEL478) TaxID=1344416 RepID=A0A139AYP7_GONPJ|nr:hypothetical protein M427DRAFT_51209 [Gonapodya prolifera JEL478]|eukprot:KXS21837.1 hypothetical protein M427DRAFT_51209 [Gonapodya prolifera JEL478]